MGKWAAVFAVGLSGLFSPGCTSQSEGTFAEMPGSSYTGSGSAGSAGSPTNYINGDSFERIRAGEALTITFTDTPTAILPFEEVVKDDGTITLQQNQTFVAAGKVRGELEKEIRARYVPAYYVNLTVTIKLQERLYYIGGEVRNPNRYAWANGTTVLKAIQAAGDFTDYANKKKVRIQRSDGRIDTINCIKAIDDPRLDAPIYPGDKIHVPRKMF